VFINLTLLQLPGDHITGTLTGAISVPIHQWSFRKTGKWERWRAKRKLVFGSKHRGRFCWVPMQNFWDCIYAKSCNTFCGRKIVCNADHNAFLNTITMGTAFLCVPCPKLPLLQTLEALLLIVFWSAQVRTGVRSFRPAGWI